MTIIVAVEHEDGVVVACDSQVTEMGTSFLLHTSQRKIGTNGPYIIGAAGRLRTGQVMLNASDLPVPDGVLSDEELNRFMVNKFANSAQEAMDEAGVETTRESERLLTESELIVCIQGRAYSIGEDYCAFRASDGAGDVHGVVVAGSGWKFSLGAYHALANDGVKRSPEELATMLVQAALRWDQACGGDILMLSQERP